MPKEFRKFKGQIIESLCICGVCIELEAFRPYAESTIKILLDIQNNYLQGDDDPIRKYLLAAWQRLCLLMEKEFAPYLKDIMPGVFQMAAMKPHLKVNETGEDILKFLSDVSSKTGEKAVTVASDEIEQKNIGIHMLCVIIDELEELYAPFIEDTSKLFLSLTTFDYNVSIRSSVADTFPTMLKAVKKSSQDQTEVLNYAQTYIQALFDAMRKESETDVMHHQVSGIKRCIDVMGEFLDETQVNNMCEILFSVVQKSDHRKHINIKYTEENEQGENEVDKQNREFMKEENEMEDDLQLAISETFGALFKTHKNHCKELLNSMFTSLLPQYLDEGAPFVKQKFALYIVVDLVEYLGYEYLGEKIDDCYQVIQKYTQESNPIYRQAGVYGLGITAVNGGEFFSKVGEQTIELLKKAILIERGSQDKVEFLHAKDNAISAMAKVMKHQFS
jgi:importin-5